jgi:disulfide bond formation protein DsbB
MAFRIRPRPVSPRCSRLERPVRRKPLETRLSGTDKGNLAPRDKFLNQLKSLGDFISSRAAWKRLSEPKKSAQNAPETVRVCAKKSGSPLISAEIPVMAAMKSTDGETLRVQNDTAPALLAGGFSLALLLGAFAFQYLGGLAPCEMCIWQRWPHAAAILLGLGGGALALTRVLHRDMVRVLAWLAMAAIVVSGAIGVFHAGVEWKLWAGPSACTGIGFVPGQDDFKPFQVVRCDEAQWRLLGISLAGYNAILSFAAAAVLARLLTRRTA